MKNKSFFLLSSLNHKEHFWHPFDYSRTASPWIIRFQNLEELFSKSGRFRKINCRFATIQSVPIVCLNLRDDYTNVLHFVVHCAAQFVQYRKGRFSEIPKWTVMPYFKPIHSAVIQTLQIFLVWTWNEFAQLHRRY